MLWTVARFPSGAWTYGGRLDDPDYSECEKWRIDAEAGPQAVRKAQAIRHNGKARAEECQHAA